MSRSIQIHHVTLLLIGFCMLSACSQQANPPTIPQTQLIEILCDVHIVEGALQNRPKEQKDSVAVVYYNGVYERHQITEEDFLTSLERLEADPKLMSEVYRKVMIRLDTMERRSVKEQYKKK